MPITPTRATKAEDIDKAKEERVEQAYWAAIDGYGPLPQNEEELRRWCWKANLRWRRALKRLN